MNKTLVEKYVEDPDHMRLFQQERAIYEVVVVLESLMEKMGVSRAELAKRLGRSRGWVTQLLDGEANKTIRTVADAFAVLGHEYLSSYQPIQISGSRTATLVDLRPDDGAIQPVILRFVRELHQTSTSPLLIEEKLQAVTQ